MGCGGRVVGRSSRRLWGMSLGQHFFAGSASTSRHQGSAYQTEDDLRGCSRMMFGLNSIDVANCCVRG